MARRKKLVIALLIFLIALLPRLYQIGQTPIFGDEVTWTVWGKEIIYSVINGNLGNYHAWYNDTTEGHDIGFPLTPLIGISHIIFTGESRLGLGWLPPIVASRVVNVVIASLTPVAMFLIGSQFVGAFAAFTAAILFSLTPVIIGVDRWVFHDSMLTLTSFLALGIFILKARDKKISFIPGIFLGLAFLTKPTGAFPFISWMILAIPQKNRRFVIRLMAVNAISALATVLIVWPESWRRPVISIFEYMFKIVKLPGDETPSFYFGKSTLDPGPTFYFFQLFGRLPEIIILFIFFPLISFRKRLKKISNQSLSIIAYCLLYFIFMSFLPLKTSFRYILPILPWIYLYIGKHTPRALFVIAVGLLMISNSYYHPDYYVYYNQLIGGPGNAAKYDQVPLCYASKSGLKFLNENHIPGSIYIAGCAAGEPYYQSGRTFTQDYNEADIVIVGTELRQKDPSKLEKILEEKHWLKSITVKESPVGEIWLKD